MEKSPLINRDNGLIDKAVIIKYPSNIKIYIFLSVILTLQIFCTTYLILIGKFAQDLDLFNMNTTETNDYIDRFKSIIDYVCHNMVNCSKP